MEFEWNISQDTIRCRSIVRSLLLRLDETPQNFTGRITLMSMFNDISCGSNYNEKECLANAKLVSLYAKRFGKGQWSFIGPGSEKKWYCIFPGVISKAKDTENCRYILLRIIQQLRLCFAYLFLQTSSVFTEQSRKCVKSMNPFTRERGDPL